MDVLYSAKLKGWPLNSQDLLRCRRSRRIFLLCSSPYRLLHCNSQNGLEHRVSPVTDLNKGCSFLTVLKLKVWRGVCSYVRLDTEILIVCNTPKFAKQSIHTKTKHVHNTITKPFNTSKYITLPTSRYICHVNLKTNTDKFWMFAVWSDESSKCTINMWCAVFNI